MATPTRTPADRGALAAARDLIADADGWDRRNIVERCEALRAALLQVLDLLQTPHGG